MLSRKNEGETKKNEIFFLTHKTTHDIGGGMQHPPSLVGRGTSALAPDAPFLSKRSRDRSRIGSEVWLHRHQPAVPSTQAACGERSPGLDIDVGSQRPSCPGAHRCYRMANAPGPFSWTHQIIMIGNLKTPGRCLLRPPITSTD